MSLVHVRNSNSDDARLELEEMENIRSTTSSEPSSPSTQDVIMNTDSHFTLSPTKSDNRIASTIRELQKCTQKLETKLRSIDHRIRFIEKEHRSNQTQACTCPLARLKKLFQLERERESLARQQAADDNCRCVIS
jgi:hypothetical protein